MGLDNEKGRQELRPRGPSSMLPLNFIIKDALISLIKIFRQQIYPRVNISELLHPLPSGTRCDNLVMRTRCKNSIQTLLRSVFRLSPLGPLWARFPYQFSRNWNTRRDRTYPPSTSLPPLPRPVTPLWRSANIVWRRPLRRLNHRSGKVPTLKRWQSVNTRKPVSTWIFGTRPSLSNTGPWLVSANHLLIYSRGSYIPWATLACLGAKPKWPCYNHI